MLTPVGAESSALAGARSMIARGIGGATALPHPVRADGSIRADVEVGTIHLSVPFSTDWQVLLNGENVAVRPAFGLTNAYDITKAGNIEMSLRPSNLHTLMVLLQFAGWCLVLFVAFSRRRRVPRTAPVQALVSDGPVIVLSEGASA